MGLLVAVDVLVTLWVFIGGWERGGVEGGGEGRGVGEEGLRRE